MTPTDQNLIIQKLSLSLVSDLLVQFLRGSKTELERLGGLSFVHEILLLEES